MLHLGQDEAHVLAVNAVAARAKLDNFSFRTTWAWDITANAWKMRIDAAFGFAGIRREWAVRLQG